jgi:hypothetical protein
MAGVSVQCQPHWRELSPLVVVTISRRPSHPRGRVVCWGSARNGQNAVPGDLVNVIVVVPGSFIVWL